MRYLVIAETKAAKTDPAADQPTPADATDPASATPPDPNAPEHHQWAGDPADSDTEVSHPEDAFARFTGTQGEEAWLDKTSDGTLTGWVRDSDGTAYRYSDVDAWAVDVDDAGMTRVDAPADTENTEPAPDAEQPEAETPPATPPVQTLFDDNQRKSLTVAVRAVDL